MTPSEDLYPNLLFVQTQKLKNVKKSLFVRRNFTIVSISLSPNSFPFFKTRHQNFEQFIFIWLRLVLSEWSLSLHSISPPHL